MKKNSKTPHTREAINTMYYNYKNINTGTKLNNLFNTSHYLQKQHAYYTINASLPFSENQLKHKQYMSESFDFPRQ